MSWTGMPFPFTIQNLIKALIFKMMALHGALVCDWKLSALTKLGLVMCLIKTLAEQLYRDRSINPSSAMFLGSN